MGFRRTIACMLALSLMTQLVFPLTAGADELEESIESLDDLADVSVIGPDGEEVPTVYDAMANADGEIMEEDENMYFYEEEVFGDETEEEILPDSLIEDSLEEVSIAEGADLASYPMSIGEEYCGFVLEDIYESPTLNSVQYTFRHMLSGAQLVYVSNDDPETVFSISYRTPCLDRSDANHVFEHAILASSEKYPSKDIFFDLSSKAYLTDLNAFTAPTFTSYYISSMSQEQLLKAADVYMSCMEAPSILTNENYFLREALRYELEDPEGSITMSGTVFSEDLDDLTEIGTVNRQQVLDALYHGEYASNVPGTAHLNYRDLTYERVLATYQRYYHYDNCLIYLYGDLEFRRFLQFLDTNYLGDAPAPGTDLSIVADPETVPGYTEVTGEVPVYEGDETEQSSMITYAMDLSGETQTQLKMWEIFAAGLNMPGSPLYRTLIEMGERSPVTALASVNMAKPYFEFMMEYAGEEQKEELKQVVTKALEEVSQTGFDPELLEVIVHEQQLYGKLLRDQGGVGVGISEPIAAIWAQFGNTQYLKSWEEAINTLAADTQQSVFKEMAAKLLSPSRSALVTTVPVAGLAEQYDEEREAYLASMKASMSEEQLRSLAEKTSAFKTWNESELSSNAFQIDVSSLPDPRDAAPMTVTQMGDVTVFQGVADIQGAVSNRVYFDLSGMSREEIEYLMLYSSYLFQMDTQDHSAGELYLKAGEYLSGLDYSLIYPGQEAGAYHYPMLRVAWKCLTEDFSASLDLLLEILLRTDLTKGEMLAYLTQVMADNWDMARQEGAEIAFDGATSGAGVMADSSRMELDANGQDCYWLLKEILGKLQENPETVGELAESLENSRRKAFTRDRIIFMTAASVLEGDEITRQAVERLGMLNKKPEDCNAVYELPDVKKTTAICIEDSMNNTIMASDYRKDPGFLGSYIPFYYAMADKYTVPVFRFRLGAYSADSIWLPDDGILTTGIYADPNVKDTLDALREMGAYLDTMSLTQEELNGYILKAYSAVVRPSGVLDGVLSDMGGVLMGMAPETEALMAQQVRFATLGLQPEAVRHIQKVLEDSTICTVGNEAMIRKDADCFEEVVSYR